MQTMCLIWFAVSVLYYCVHLSSTLQVCRDSFGGWSKKAAGSASVYLPVKRDKGSRPFKIPDCHHWCSTNVAPYSPTRHSEYCIIASGC